MCECVSVVVAMRKNIYGSTTHFAGKSTIFSANRAKYGLTHAPRVKRELLGKEQPGQDKGVMGKMAPGSEIRRGGGR